MSLRVAHVTATFPPYTGGTGNVCYHNARELARRGHTVHVFTTSVRGTPSEEMKDGLVVHRLKPIFQAGNASLVLELYADLVGFDVIHLHYPFFGGEITALAAKIHCIPLFITYHQDVLFSGLKGVVERIHRLTLDRWIFQLTSRLLLTSLDYGRFSHIHPFLLDKAHRIAELPNGVDISLFHPGEPDHHLRSQLQLADSDKVVLIVSGLDRPHYFKGINVFLEALACLPSDIKGVIVGDGDLRPDYAAQAKRLNITSRVIFAGRVSNEDLLRYYRLARVTVLPSINMGEAFGLVLVESMASGTPVIATNLPGVRTVVDQNEDGFLIEPNNASALAEAIQNILSDEPRRQRMGQRGRAKVKLRYDWEQIGKRLERIYQEVLVEG